MKKNLLALVSLCSTLTAVGMKREFTAQEQAALLNLPQETITTLIALSDGKSRNELAKTCKELYDIAAYKHRNILLQHPQISLGPIEKHLLLFEYAQEDNLEMFNHMITLGAQYNKLLQAFGRWHDLFPTSDDHSQEVYSPHLALFPKNREPSACIYSRRTILHIAAVHNSPRIAKKILDEIEQRMPDLAALKTQKKYFSRNMTVAIVVDTDGNRTLSQEYNHFVAQLGVYNSLKSYVDSIDAYCSHALHLAAEHNSLKIVELFLALKKAPIDIASKNAAGATPLDIAREKGHTEIVQLLLAAQHQDQN